MAILDDYRYTDIIFEIKGEIGIIKVRGGSLSGHTFTHGQHQLNRPKSLNSFGGRLRIDVLTALRVLDEHPNTVFTVLTGEGRFFSSGADVMGAYK
jgi:peroxisomal 3,2-trans-enoyl-CoA isomerase